MSMKNEIFISGAGPVGLAAALFLKRQGISVRIFETLEEPVQKSKALAVNLRTLEILETTGVTEKMLQLGLPMKGAHFWRDGKIEASLSLEPTPHGYPYMLALSQAVTERLLTESLSDLGVKIERGTTVTDCKNTDDGVEIEIQKSAGKKEALPGAKLIAADGAHSLIRQKLGVDFPGSTFDKEWYLLDVRLATILPQDHAHLLFPKAGGFIFLLRVVEDLRLPLEAAPIWRIISNFPKPEESLQEHIDGLRVDGAPVWQSQFRVSHRINEHLAVKNIFFAGDAAHIHSPVGARGMNLGIEDAWTFSQFLQRGHLDHYDSYRRKVDQSVVKKVDLLSRLAVAEQPALRLLRSPLIRFLFNCGPARHLLIKAMSGTDHPCQENS